VRIRICGLWTGGGYSAWKLGVGVTNCHCSGGVNLKYLMLTCLVKKLHFFVEPKNPIMFLTMNQLKSVHTFMHFLTKIDFKIVP
jgi:hypothetical protein